MDYPAYPVYRESGIEWLGKIPDHWELKKFRFLFSFGRGLGITKENLLDEGVPCINYGEIHSKYGFEVIPEKHPLKCVTPDYLETGTSSLLSAGDFIFADTSEDIEGSGNFSHLNSDIPTFAGYHTVIARPISNDFPRYIAYLFDSLPYRFQIRKTVSGVKVFSITQAILKNCYLWLPKKTEQIQIAQFLDHKTQQIDQLLAKKQTLIDKLNEQRIALITHAVSKGLNPDVTLEDSGVEWLGEVPEHWEVVKLSYRYEVLLGKMLDDKRITGDFLGEYLRNTDVQWGRINYESLPQMDFRPDEYERYSIKKGDLVVCEGGEIGRCAIWERETPCFYQKALHRLRPVDPKNDNARFMFYVLFDAVHQERFINGASKATIAHLPAETFRQYRFAYPPMIEQREIVEYLDRETVRIDRMVELNQQTIDKLKEYRTALITAAVTGKIDLRTWQKMETKGA
ncbi:restriction endonuclease subunit S [Candidatus Thiothrix anitrata]|uniref:Restriction endonuclease subunit S n=1 Tax=Candidatus Thiothrix anitrata TaxID=2823902 RepID=A0ABX7X4M9_9GAMM|nr:restriction endonuclease subunit S [Candidatus Thiothrix anitrata]QTR50825.1 restriction endonuclease subunit S [Candidatus Thiothrix anitrata]